MYMVQRLKRKDRRLVDVICESLKTAYDPTISRFFVHQDVGYKKFFSSVLDHPSYATYYSYDSISGELHGFACFQIIDNIIFLKHIVVDNRLRGSKIGTKLLYHALHEIQEMNKEQCTLFQLNVFEKNSRALSWYLSIGMEIIDCTYWYDLLPTIKPLLTNAENKGPQLSFSQDTFGFVQISYENQFIGTLLAKKTLIVKNPKILKHLSLLAPFVQQNKIESLGFMSDMVYDFDMVDKALLMSTSVHTMALV